MIEPSIVSFDGQEFAITRKKLREWLTLEDYVSDISEAAEAQDIDGFIGSLCSYVSAAVGIDEVETKFVVDVINCLEVSLELNRPNPDLPMLWNYEDGKKPSSPVWEYKGRQWYFWLNTLASAYGWKSEYIAELDIDDAFSLFQEITIGEQLRREWDWGLSEIAYPYNSSTKKSEFREYPRPKWMQFSPTQAVQKVKKIKIRKDMIPIGNVVRYKPNDKETDD